MPNAALRELDKIIGRGLIGGESVAQELRERLIREMVANKDIMSVPELIVLARNILHEVDPIIAHVLSKTEMAAWVEGIMQIARTAPQELIDHLAERNPINLTRPPGRGGDAGRGRAEEPSEPIVVFPRLEEAHRELTQRRIVTRPQFDIYEDWLKRKSFTVAYQSSEETIEKIRDVLVETIQEGPSLKVFKDSLTDAIGASAIGEAHLENVFRTNIQTAFSNGQESIANNAIVRSVFPFAAYHPIDDGRVRDEHLALFHLGLESGNIYWADDPMWNLFTPPWGYNCRCSKTFLTIKQAGAYGLKIASKWDRTGKPPAHKEFRLSSIPFRPEGGFVGPGASAVA